MTPRILIVEDEPALAELLEWNFKSAGYEVAQTADGEEALLLAEEFVPDIIILDWMIEQMPGIEVCRRLRKRRETAEIPVIMLTTSAIFSSLMGKRFVLLSSSHKVFAFSKASPNFFSVSLKLAASSKR